MFWVLKLTYNSVQQQLILFIVIDFNIECQQMTCLLINQSYTFQILLLKNLFIIFFISVIY